MGHFIAQEESGSEKDQHLDSLQRAKSDEANKERREKNAFERAEKFARDADVRAKEQQKIDDAKRIERIADVEKAQRKREELMLKRQEDQRWLMLEQEAHRKIDYDGNLKMIERCRRNLEAIRSELPSLKRELRVLTEKYLELDLAIVKERENTGHALLLRLKDRDGPHTTLGTLVAKIRQSTQELGQILSKLRRSEDPELRRAPVQVGKARLDSLLNSLEKAVQELKLSARDAAGHGHRYRLANRIYVADSLYWGIDKSSPNHHGEVLHLMSQFHEACVDDMFRTIWGLGQACKDDLSRTVSPARKFLHRKVDELFFLYRVNMKVAAQITNDARAFEVKSRLPPPGVCNRPDVVAHAEEVDPFSAYRWQTYETIDWINRLEDVLAHAERSHEKSSSSSTLSLVKLRRVMTALHLFRDSSRRFFNQLDVFYHANMRRNQTYRLSRSRLKASRIPLLRKPAMPRGPELRGYRVPDIGPNDEKVEIEYIVSNVSLFRLAREFMQSRIVGMELVYEPHQQQQNPRQKLPMLLLANEHKVAIVHLAYMVAGETYPLPGPPNSFRSLLEDPCVLKAGYDIGMQAALLREWLRVELSGQFELKGSASQPELRRHCSAKTHSDGLSDLFYTHFGRPLPTWTACPPAQAACKDLDSFQWINCKQCSGLLSAELTLCRLGIKTTCCISPVS